MSARRGENLVRLDYFAGDECDLAQRMANASRRIEAVRMADGDRRALQFLMDSIGLKVADVRNDNYCRRALDYHLGVVLAVAGQPERAVELIHRAGLLPDAGGEQLYSDAVAESLVLDRWRRSAQARGMPSVLISSMPRAASATFTQTLAGALGVPVLRLSVGALGSNCLVPNWLNRFSPGGAITHDHFGASDFNVKVLSETGNRRVVVLARDPRAAAASLVQMGVRAGNYGASREEIESRIVDGMREFHGPWLGDWLKAEESGAIEVEWVRSLDVTGPRAEDVYRRVLAPHVPLYPALRPILRRPFATVTANLVRGDDNAWRTMVSEEARRALWDAIPPRLVELMELEP